MRTFIAIELSEEIKKELSRLQEGLKKAEADVKWVKPENIHLTLKFLGNTEDTKIEEIRKVLDDISSRNTPFEISLSTLGAFPSLDHPRVIWIGLDKGAYETEKLANLIEGPLEKIGFPKESRSFSAHLTLGRVKSGRNKVKLKQAISTIKIVSKSCKAGKITLFQSTLTPHGAIYTALHAAEFKGK